MTRADDMRLLADALELETLSPGAREAFADMAQALRASPSRTLSDKQREWVARELDVPTYAPPCGARLADVRHNHGENAACGASCPAWVPDALKVLPKRPPVRRMG